LHRKKGGMKEPVVRREQANHQDSTREKNLSGKGAMDIKKGIVRPES